MQNFDFQRQHTIPSSRPLQPSFIIPQKIGSYHIESLLHQGGMSSILLGFHPNYKKPLAIKVLSPFFLSNKEIVTQFLKEAKIIALLDHPNIVKFFDQGKWEKGFFLVMEFIQGISLKQFILYKALSFSYAIKIILQISYALLHLHSHGIIHKDLKPENILITENGTIKLVDFGIAQFSPDKRTLSKNIQTMGTPNYMSPEQKKNASTISFNTDIYSLGVIICELIIGKPFTDFTQMHPLSSPLQSILKKALHPSPYSRYQDIVDMIGDIASFMKNYPTKEQENATQQSSSLLHTPASSPLITSLPSWPDMEIHLMPQSETTFLSLYIDFFHLPDHSSIIIFAQPSDPQLSIMIALSTLKGYMQACMQNYMHTQNYPFSFNTLIMQLNTFAFHNQLSSSIAFTILHLTPDINEFSFISSGLESIWLSPLNYSSRHVNILHNQSPPLGQAAHFGNPSTTSPWNPGDLLILHSFISPNISETQRKELETLTLKVIRTHRQAFPNILIKNLYQTLQTYFFTDSSKAILALLRIK